MSLGDLLTRLHRLQAMRADLGQRKKINMQDGRQATAENRQNPYIYFSAVALDREEKVQLDNALTKFEAHIGMSHF